MWRPPEPGGPRSRVQRPGRSTDVTWLRMTSLVLGGRRIPVFKNVYLCDTAPHAQNVRTVLLHAANSIAVEQATAHVCGRCGGGGQPHSRMSRYALMMFGTLRPVSRAGRIIADDLLAKYASTSCFDSQEIGAARKAAEAWWGWVGAEAGPRLPL